VGAQYKTEVFRPNPYSIIRDTFYPVVEKALSLDDYLRNYNSVVSRNKAATKMKTLSSPQRWSIEALKRALNNLDVKSGHSNWTAHILQEELQNMCRALFACSQWQGSDFTQKYTGIRIECEHGFNQTVSRIWNNVVVPCLNGQCEEWLKEMTPKYKAVGYQFRTFVCTHMMLTDKQWEQQISLCLPDLERKLGSDRFVACFEPIPK